MTKNSMARRSPEGKKEPETDTPFGLLHWRRPYLVGRFIWQLVGVLDT